MNDPSRGYRRRGMGCLAGFVSLGCVMIVAASWLVLGASLAALGGAAYFAHKVTHLH